MFFLPFKKLWVMLLTTMVIFSPICTLAIEWEKTFGGSETKKCYSVKQTADGEYVVTGYSSGDLYLLKIDSNGNGEWSRTFGGGSGWSVDEATDGGFIIVGNYRNNNEKKLFFIKTDSDGSSIWENTYGQTGYEAGGRSVQQTADGGYIIAGYIWGNDPRSREWYLLKTNSSGELFWSKRYEFWETFMAHSAQQTIDGGYIVVGVGVDETYLLKTDFEGNEIWKRKYDYGLCDSSDASVQQTFDGGYIVGGTTGQCWYFGNYVPPSMYLMKTDADGNEMWGKTYGGNSGWSVQQTTDGGYITVGSTRSTGDGHSSDVFLVKTDSNGNAEWSRVFGGEESDCGYSVQQTTDSGYIIAGDKGGDIYLVKVDDSIGNGYPGIASWYSPPSSPFFTVSTDGLDVFMSWEASGADGYRLFYVPMPYTGPSSIDQVDMKTNTSFSTTLWKGASFAVAVQAYNDIGDSSLSNIEQFTITSPILYNRLK